MGKQEKLIAILMAVVMFGALFFVNFSTRANSTRSSKIRRTILLNFKPEATPADIQKIFKEVKENISQLKGVHNLFIGAQVNERASFKYGISMDFDDDAALKAYRADQEHRQTHNKYNHLIEQAQITDIRDE
ncbi:MAG TPA: Dabb family protein [Pyrinomonadaceae bacterium]|nr:Dabb family protein [Pyrinomonadaceae bacterium]